MSQESDRAPLSVRIPEACRLTGIGRSKLYELIADGELDIIKIGSRTLIPIDSLRLLLDAKRVTAGSIVYLARQ